MNSKVRVINASVIACTYFTLSTELPTDCENSKGFFLNLVQNEKFKVNSLTELLMN
jgi:hypothetical protein